MKEFEAGKSGDIHTPRMPRLRRKRCGKFVPTTPSMYKVIMSICNPVLKDQVCNHENYEEINNKQDTLGLLQIIKKTMYSNGDDDNHMGYNHVVAVVNYYRIQQERFQSLQEYSLLPTGRCVSIWASRLVHQKMGVPIC